MFHDDSVYNIGLSGCIDDGYIMNVPLGAMFVDDTPRNSGWLAGTSTKYTKSEKSERSDQTSLIMSPEFAAGRVSLPDLSSLCDSAYDHESTKLHAIAESSSILAKPKDVLKYGYDNSQEDIHPRLLESKSLLYREEVSSSSYSYMQFSHDVGSSYLANRTCPLLEHAKSQTEPIHNAEDHKFQALLLLDSVDTTPAVACSKLVTLYSTTPHDAQLWQKVDIVGACHQSEGGPHTENSSNMSDIASVANEDTLHTSRVISTCLPNPAVSQIKAKVINPDLLRSFREKIVHLNMYVPLSLLSVNAKCIPYYKRNNHHLRYTGKQILQLRNFSMMKAESPYDHPSWYVRYMQSQAMYHGHLFYKDTTGKAITAFYNLFNSLDLKIMTPDTITGLSFLVSMVDHVLLPLTDAQDIENKDIFHSPHYAFDYKVTMQKLFDEVHNRNNSRELAGMFADSICEVSSNLDNMPDLQEIYATIQQKEQEELILLQQQESHHPKQYTQPVQAGQFGLRMFSQKPQSSLACASYDTHITGPCEMNEKKAAVYEPCPVFLHVMPYNIKNDGFECLRSVTPFAPCKRSTKLPIARSKSFESYMEPLDTNDLLNPSSIHEIVQELYPEHVIGPDDTKQLVELFLAEHVDVPVAKRELGTDQCVDWTYYDKTVWNDILQHEGIDVATSPMYISSPSDKDEDSYALELVAKIYPTRTPAQTLMEHTPNTPGKRSVCSQSPLAPFQSKHFKLS